MANYDAASIDETPELPDQVNVAGSHFGMTVDDSVASDKRRRIDLGQPSTTAAADPNAPTWIPPPSVDPYRCLSLTDQ